MKKSLFVPIVLLAGLCAQAVTAFPQAPTKAGVVGTWIGTATVDNQATGFDITMVLAKAETGYVGKLSDASGAIPESPVREIVFKDNKLTCLFDLPETMGAMLISIELTLENETLKGTWSGSDGSSGAIELTLRKQPSGLTF